MTVWTFNVQGWFPTDFMFSGTISLVLRNSSFPKLRDQSFIFKSISSPSKSCNTTFKTIKVGLFCKSNGNKLILWEFCFHWLSFNKQGFFSTNAKQQMSYVPKINKNIQQTFPKLIEKCEIVASMYYYLLFRD